MSDRSMFEVSRESYLREAESRLRRNETAFRALIDKTTHHGHSIGLLLERHKKVVAIWDSEPDDDGGGSDA